MAADGVMPGAIVGESPHIELRSFGHACLVLLENAEPLIATDPWLVGSVYWRSWWLERYPTPDEFDLIASVPFVYITHSHPDHFHPPTLRRMGRPHTLHPKFPHYPVPGYLREHGTPASTLEPLRRYSLTADVSIASIPCPVDDSILVIDTPMAIIVNLNDSNPPRSVLACIRANYIARKEPNIGQKAVVVLKSYSPASSAVSTYRDGVRAPLLDKRDYVRRAEEMSRALGATHYIPFASQAFFSRNDSLWANEHKVFYQDMVHHWTDHSIELCAPFVHMDLTAGTHSSRTRATDLALDGNQLEKIRVRAEEEDSFSLPDDFATRLRDYFISVRLLRLLVRRGVGIRLSSSQTEWFYDLRSKTVEPGLPHSVEIVITLPDRILYEALVNGILTDLGITMLIRVDTSVDVRRAFLVFSLMGLRDYGYTRSMGRALQGGLFYMPFVLPQIYRGYWRRRSQKAPAPMPTLAAGTAGASEMEAGGGLTVEISCNLCGRNSARLVRVENSYRICRCLHCGLFYVNPQPALRTDEDVHYLPDVSPVGDAAREDGGDRMIAHALDDLARSVGGSGRLLDVGCGYGLFLKAAEASGWDCAGVDVSEVGVRYARERLGLANVRRGNLHSAPYSDASFDAVTIWNVLEHVADPRGLLHEAMRLLRPSGVLLVRVPNMAFHDLLWKVPGVSRLGGRVGLKYLGGVAPPQHLFGFTPRTLTALLKNVGFQRIQIEAAIPHNPQSPVRRAVAVSTDLVHRLSSGRLQVSPTVVAYATRPDQTMSPRRSSSDRDARVKS